MLAPLDIFDPSSYPTRRDEDWKYSDLSRVLRSAPHRAAIYGNTPPTVLGNFVAYQLREENSNELQAFSENAKGKLALFISEGGEDDDLPAPGVQWRSEMAIRAGDTLVLFERYSGYDNYVSSTALDFVLGENASLTRIVILDEPAEAVSIRRSTVKTAPGATFKQYVFSTGAKFQRFETHVSHAGHGAHVELNGAYLLKDKRHFDLTTRVTHGEIDGTTAQLIKGLVRDSATGVFQGRILVERGADGTDARMRHQALILNDGAHIRAKPELEIYADDVQCAHGNTIGALDEEALFFAMSRGIPEDAARAMLTQAFVMPVADLIEDEQVREKVIDFLAQHVERFGGSGHGL